MYRFMERSSTAVSNFRDTMRDYFQNSYIPAGGIDGMIIVRLIQCFSAINRPSTACITRDACLSPLENRHRSSIIRGRILRKAL